MEAIATLVIFAIIVIGIALLADLATKNQDDRVDANRAPGLLCPKTYRYVLETKSEIEKINTTKK